MVCDKFDLVVIAGDLLDIGSIVPLEAQVVVVRKYLARMANGPPILIASGNHDLLRNKETGEKDASWLQREANKRVKVDGDFFVFGDFCFSILPWWETLAQKATIQQQLEMQSHFVEGRDWIWVYHSPPKGSPVAWNGSEDWGDVLLNQLAGKYAPRMVLCGHVHQAPFYADGAWMDEIGSSLFFNGGRQLGAVPTFIEIDTDKGEARWVSAEGVEEENERLKG